MGEIRSTLDIIMEKTAGLTMTAEEKRAFKEQEMAGKLKGLIQKFWEGVLDMEKLKTGIGPLLEENEEMVRRLIKEESIQRVKLGQDNEPILRILEEVVGLPTDRIRKALEETQETLLRDKEVLEKKLLHRLEERGISGSAVIPNTEADSEWAQHVTEVKEAFEEGLRALIKP